MPPWPSSSRLRKCEPLAASTKRRARVCGSSSRAVCIVSSSSCKYSYVDVERVGDTSRPIEPREQGTAIAFDIMMEAHASVRSMRGGRRTIEGTGAAQGTHLARKLQTTHLEAAHDGRPAGVERENVACGLVFSQGSTSMILP